MPSLANTPATVRAMSPTQTRRQGKLYRYYVCQAAPKGEASHAQIQRVSAASIEAAVIDQLRALLKSPEFVMATWHAATANGAELPESTVREALDRLWEELFPAEQVRIVQLLVQRIDLERNGGELQLRTQGLGTWSRNSSKSGAPRGIGAGTHRRDHQSTVCYPQARWARAVLAPDDVR